MPTKKQLSTALRQANKTRTATKKKTAVHPAIKKISFSTDSTTKPAKSPAPKAKTEAERQLDALRQHGSAITHIPLDELAPSPLNPRTVKHTAEELRAIGESIVAVGIIEPLIARPKAAAGNPGVKDGFEIVMGEGRWRAANLMRKEGKLPRDFRLPVSVRRLDDVTLLEIAGAENIGRASMHPMDEADLIKHLREYKRGNDQIMTRLGMPERTFFRRVELLNLAAGDAQLYRDGKITGEQALHMAAAKKRAANPPLPLDTVKPDRAGATKTGTPAAAPPVAAGGDDDDDAPARDPNAKDMFAREHPDAKPTQTPTRDATATGSTYQGHPLMRVGTIDFDDTHSETVCIEFFRIAAGKRHIVSILLLAGEARRLHGQLAVRYAAGKAS